MSTSISGDHKGCGQCKKEIKDAYPKKVCHMLKVMLEKKIKKKKDAYPKKVCHMPTRHVKKEKKRER